MCPMPLRMRLSAPCEVHRFQRSRVRVDAPRARLLQRANQSGKREAGSGKREAGSGKREAGSWKLEAGNYLPFPPLNVSALPAAVKLIARSPAWPETR